MKKRRRKTMNKYTIAQILEAWETAFGEDMMTEYPGFIQRLTEEQEPKPDLPEDVPFKGRL